MGGIAMELQEWLDQVKEPILEPERRICDPHHHLWDRSGNRYLIDELAADTGSGHNIVSTVFVECLSMYRADGDEAMKVVGETEFVQGVAAMSASGGWGPCRAASGIVGHARLLLGDAIQPVLEAHVAASPNRFRGIRDASAWHPSPDIRNSHTNPTQGMLADPQFRKGFAHLVNLGLSFDAWFYHPQMDELADLARAFPQANIILDHFGGPLGIAQYAGKQRDVFNEWFAGITRVAACPNVVVKIGGINMPINGFGWDKRPLPPTSEELAVATREYYDISIELFGPNRCMFESNFPVDKVSVSYPVLWNSFKRIAAQYREDEKDALFYGTATRTYRI
jgi:predicted TIM-barrel fold metal-dependent hydrolase